MCRCLRRKAIIYYIDKPIVNGFFLIKSRKVCPCVFKKSQLLQLKYAVIVYHLVQHLMEDTYIFNTKWIQIRRNEVKVLTFNIKILILLLNEGRFLKDPHEILNTVH